MPLPTYSDIKDSVTQRCRDELPLNCVDDDSCCNLSLENGLRILIPAAAGYGAGRGTELAIAHCIAAISCCGCWTPAMTATTIALGSGCVRTHVPAMYQLDCHRALWSWIMEKAGLSEAESVALLANETQHERVIISQPRALNGDYLRAGEEPSRVRDICTRIATRGVASFAPGFAMATMPAALSVFCPEVAWLQTILHWPELPNIIQAGVPSCCGFWHDNADTRAARRRDAAIGQAYNEGIAAQPRPQ